LCFFHANPNKAVELGRIGGKTNGLVRVGLCLLPSLDSAFVIRDTVARLISDVYQGKLHPRIAAGLAPLMHLQLRAVEKTGIERRLAKLERQFRVVLGEDRHHRDELCHEMLSVKQKPSSHTAMKTARSLWIIAFQRLVYDWGLPLRPRSGMMEGD
jgi:hypothetical protein